MELFSKWVEVRDVDTTVNDILNQLPISRQELIEIIGNAIAKNPNITFEELINIVKKETRHNYLAASQSGRPSWKTQKLRAIRSDIN